jgi:hypothetical protein
MIASVTYSTVQIDDVTEVTVATSMTDVVYYCWYVDDAYVGKTASPTRSFQVESGEHLRVTCIPTDDEDFDPVQNAPDGFPGKRTLWWCRSLDSAVAQYRIDQKSGDGDWAELATLSAVDGQWAYSFTTDTLDDCTSYTWRVVPINADGVEGTALTIGPETIIRYPDAPDFSATFDANSQTLAFAEVSA